jgi:hypothetical protein
VPNSIDDKYILIDNTYITIPKADIRDRIDLEVGDSKQHNQLFPQVKIMRWDNEVNCSIRLKDDSPDTPTIKTSNNKIQYIKNKIEAHFYDVRFRQKTIHEELREKYEIKGECSKCGECCSGCHYYKNKVCDDYDNRPKTCIDFPLEGDLLSKKFPNCSFYLDKRKTRIEVEPTGEEQEGYEFEVILKEKPTTNKIEFTLNTKGLDFFYQPELTQQEKDIGDFRPESIVGSYAVYTSENKINYEGGKEYKCGKVGHIFRPKIIDNIGSCTWGILNINKEAGILSVEIPQDFLDSAIYPIKHASGLLFGYDTSGAASTTFNNKIVGSQFAGAAGTGVSISFYAKSWGATTPKCALYDSTSNLITNGTTDTGSSTSEFNTLNFTSAPTLLNQDYIIVFGGTSLLN